MTDRLDRSFSDYEKFHATHGNELCHYFGIPMIVLGLLGLLSQIHLGQSGLLGHALLRIDLGNVFWALSSVWYLVLAWRLGVPFAFLTFALYLLSRAIPLPALWILFVLGWVLQGIGHAVYEKKSPAFFQNFMHLLIGPLWIFSRVTGFKV